MELDRVAPELHATLRRFRSSPIYNALGRAIVQTVIAMMPTGTVKGVQITTARTSAHRKVRIYCPAVQRSTGALLWFHGGGFLIGRPRQDDRICAQTAQDLGIVVVSAEYRLAPRHRFPAALDDGIAAWHWLQQAALKLGLDRHRIAVGGVSAGGGLAASVVQRIADEGGPNAAAQWLFCPMLDDRTAARRELDAADNFVWSNRANAFGWRSYLKTEPGSAILPPYAAAARRDDLSSLPPAWIGVGDIDLFHDEDAAYAERLRAAGVPATLTVVPGAPHGFEAWAPTTELARTYLAGARDWLQGAIG
jgi:acetyl esterase/lipase